MWIILLAVIAAVPTVTSTVAVVTGQQQVFCEKGLEGEYKPDQTNICPGGSWANVFKLVKDNRPQPK
jgi:uncharacterized protein YqgV (UPF0045/DUF77 family)